MSAMGQQVRFLCTPEDTDQLLTAVRERGGLLLPHRSATPSSEPLPPSAAPPVFANIVRPEDLDRLDWQYISTQRHYTLSIFNPYVVDYMAGYQSNGQPHPRRGGGHGRLHMATNIYDEQGQIIEQSPELLRWAAGLMRWVKRHWTYVDGFHYEGPEAHLLLSSEQAT